jgi:hypothetical protein
MDQINLHETMVASGITSRARRACDLEEVASGISEARGLLPVWCFVAFSAVCVCALLFAGALSSTDCRVEPIPLMVGTDSEISIGVPVGIPCTILVQPGSPVIDSITVGAAPERGTLMPRGRTGVIYRPHPGFSGEDSFAFSLNSRSGSTTATSTIRVRARIS